MTDIGSATTGSCCAPAPPRGGFRCQYTGHAPPGSTDRLVVRGEIDRLEFIAFWLHEQRVLAEMNVNTWNVTNPINQLIGDRTLIDPERLADPSVPLAELTTPS
ncbi:oxidoreductase C-terminal domain-containing protein [Nocardia gamkensis]|uniref:oxidoreductase C-terminal domain-containing protein n=1 Tax=Nocardia gamkensis TaxID=352869 RepID=UPI0036E59332